MKKLLTVLSCVAMACSLQAATALWGFASADIMDSTGNYILVNGTSAQGSGPMSGDTWTVMVSPTAFGASDWKSMTADGSGGIPEPTSGLLLLVGGAMLALRRKRA